ncbi:MAG: hypothetical protein K2Q34_02765 [Alphaproteobacteria bacterium]|nr:hypothetical protein [Alphaproteobacteria bacterium]
MLKKLLLSLFLLMLGTYQIAFSCTYCDGHDCLEARTDIPKGKGASGKWKDESTPKRNWTCIEVFDREGTDTCQMCEREEVRYVHVMQHGGLTLDVGCICAAYMDGTLDEEASALREAALRARPNKLKSFMDETKWKEAKSSGNPYYTLKKSDYNPYTRKVILTKSQFNTKYSYMVLSLDEDGDTVPSKTIKSDGYLASKSVAMKAAFDSIFPPRMRVD